MNFSIYFVIYCQPIKYVFVILSLVCFNSTAPYETQANEHCITSTIEYIQVYVYKTQALVWFVICSSELKNLL